MNILKTQKDYLKFIKIKQNYKTRIIDCEICSSKHHSQIRDIVSVGNKNYFAKLPVVACNVCGFLFQNPRFSENFYKEFYSKNYRLVIYGKTSPSQEMINDQLSRGKLLYKSLKKFLPQSGNILDVGSSTGAVMKGFIDKGWTGLGIDPDQDYVEYGKNILNLPVEVSQAEKMVLKKNNYDLIIILGSLEHIYNPNKTLELCFESAKEGSYLLLEGRGHPQNHSRIYFNHNHHRYFTLNSMKLMMVKHGWEPIFTTDKEISGPTRKGSIFCLGKKNKQIKKINFYDYLKENKEEIKDILFKFEQLDKQWS